LRIIQCIVDGQESEPAGMQIVSYLCLILHFSNVNSREKFKSVLAITDIILKKPPEFFDLSPRPQSSEWQKLQNYRRDAGDKNISMISPERNCGILWTLATVNRSSLMDFSTLRSYGYGEGLFRLLTVVHEVFISAARVKNALFLNKGSHPSVCNSRPALILFADRAIFNSSLIAYSDWNGRKSVNMKEEADCLFDKIIYYDDLPFVESFLNMKEDRLEYSKVRLSPRTNALKLLALLSTPFQYTLYLDGDTAPCVGFQNHVFESLTSADMLTTANPFGYQSTRGQKTYPNCPSHAGFADFPEVNGGVLAYRWNEKTEAVFVRSLELIPFFASLDLYQDQAFLRHALFEALMQKGLVMRQGSMDRYCRHGWSCERNDCLKSCAIIHQRSCVHLGVTESFRIAIRSNNKTFANGMVSDNRYSMRKQEQQWVMNKALLTPQCVRRFETIDLSSRLQWMAGHYHKAHVLNSRKKNSVQH